MSESSKCCCRHTDARDCLLTRHPEIRRDSDETGGMYETFMDEVCECYCHVEAEEWRREFDPEPWEVRP